MEFLCGAREWVEDEIQGQMACVGQRFRNSCWICTTLTELRWTSFPVLSKPCSTADQGFSLLVMALLFTSPCCYCRCCFILVILLLHDLDIGFEKSRSCVCLWWWAWCATEQGSEAGILHTFLGIDAWNIGKDTACFYILGRVGITALILICSFER